MGVRKLFSRGGQNFPRGEDTILADQGSGGGQVPPLALLCGRPWQGANPGRENYMSDYKFLFWRFLRCQIRFLYLCWITGGVVSSFIALETEQYQLPLLLLLLFSFLTLLVEEMGHTGLKEKKFDLCQNIFWLRNVRITVLILFSPYFHHVNDFLLNFNFKLNFKY